MAQPSPNTDAIKTALQARLGERAQIKGIASTPVSGLYEVNLGSEIVYTDANARYLLQGDLLDLTKGVNLTSTRLSELNRVAFSEFPLDQAIAITRGNGRRKVIVFADPNCGYCKRLEDSLQSMNNLTIYTFLVPILSADSTIKSKQLWCAENRARAWTDWALRHIAPSGEGKCTHPIEKNLALASKLGIKSTPTLFFMDGSRMAGAAPVDAIEKKLAEVAK